MWFDLCGACGRDVQQMNMPLLPLLMLATSFAAPLPDGFVPVVAPTDAPTQYLQWAKANGKGGGLACARVWTADNLLCFRLQEGDVRRWVLHEDLRTRGISLNSLVQAAREDAVAQLSALESVPIEGMKEGYWRLRDARGWAAAALLAPQELIKLTGSKTPLYVALPTQEIAIAWSSGDAELDRVMLIGAREMFDQLTNAVSPAAHLWTGDEWRRGGEATPTEDAASGHEKSGADGARTHDL